jgi:hypothetical protein
MTPAGVVEIAVDEKSAQEAILAGTHFVGHS